MLLPFRSVMLRTLSLPNNSKQPTCTPESRVIGTPPSMAMAKGAAKLTVKSAFPAPTAWAAGAPVVAVRPTKRTSVNPSARNNGSAMYWGATQMPGRLAKIRMLVVSRPSSPARVYGARMRPAAPAMEMVVRRRRRVSIGGISILPKGFTSCLQLAFDLVKKAPVRAIGDDLLRARLDQAHFV